MDLFTTLFLINWVVLLFVVFLDINFLNDGVEEAMGFVFELWSLVSLLSIPVWAIYAIVTW